MADEPGGQFDEGETVVGASFLAESQTAELALGRVGSDEGGSLGNFRQRFAHLELVQAAIFLREAAKSWRGD